jgi:hypothetical protein
LIAAIAAIRIYNVGDLGDFGVKVGAATGQKGVLASELRVVSGCSQLNNIGWSRTHDLSR